LSNFKKNDFLNKVSGLFDSNKTKINRLQKIYLDKNSNQIKLSLFKTSEINTSKNTENTQNVLNLIKIGFSYIASNAIFFVIAGNLLPNYNFQNFRMMVNFYFTNPLSFSHWNSSLYGAIFNSYRFIFQYLESYNFKIVSNFIDRVVYSAKLPDLISIFFLSILLIFYRWYLKNQESKISFLIILSCTTILITHPIGDYHLVILVYLFLTIYNSNKADLYSTSLLIIAIIILPKVHMNSPNLNFSNLVNTLFLLWLYYINYFKYRINSQKRFNTE